MGEFLQIWLFSCIGAISLYIFFCVSFAWISPTKFEQYKAWNIRKRAARKATRANNHRNSHAVVPFDQARHSYPTKIHNTPAQHQRHDQHDDHLMHGLIASTAASSLRDDIKEAIVREMPPDDIFEDYSSNDR